MRVLLAYVYRKLVSSNTNMKKVESSDCGIDPFPLQCEVWSVKCDCKTNIPLLIAYLLWKNNNQPTNQHQSIENSFVAWMTCMHEKK